MALPDSFVHLHNHSHYSLLDGAMKCDAMAQRAADYGQPALALTDHGNMFGAVDFYLQCRKRGVKPIIGMEAYVTRDRFNRNPDKVGNRSFHMVLLARNAAGYRNLTRLASQGYLEGFYYRPRIDRELLARHSEGLIGLTACMSGEPNWHLRQGNVKAAVEAAAAYRDILGRDHYFLEIQNHGIEEEARIRQLMPEVSRQTGVPVIATNDCHFLDREHHEAHDILLAIQTGKTLNDPGRWRSNTPEVYFKSTREMLQLFQDWPEAVENTLRVADMVDFEMEMGKLLLPSFPIPDGFAGPDDYLAHLAREGLVRRFGSVTAELNERLEFELGVIRQMEFAGYFLIVWDFIDAARKLDIPVGPGRGSAAGSLVCYSMGITDIDPIRHQLLFERFLNPDRISMPDIDVDFCFEKRGRIIEYVAEKYGRENVSQIITFGTMAAKAVLKDVARVLEFPFADSNRISALVPEEVGITLQRALDEAPGLKEVAQESEAHAMLLRNALVLEGLNRNTGIHAAGVLITPSPLIEHAPLYKSTKGDITVQFDMKMSEALGLLKMDFLGLRTLTVIDKALTLIAESTGKRMTAAEIPTDDEGTFKLLQEGRTVGVFQLESSGMQELVRKMAPTCWDDITAICALYRPGPLGAEMDKVYVECKHGRRKVEFKHPVLEPILKDTYGVILYQEQVMQIASAMGGFTMAEADTLRKAMGKKNQKMMEEMKVQFLAGAGEKGLDQRLARETYEEMEFFAQYGFNKSHSAAYALLSIQTAWLKAHHPAEFMAATMTTEMRKAERITQLIDEVKALGLRILPPDINKPRSEFTVRDGDVVFGLGAVKGVGSSAIEAVAAAHAGLGRSFTDLFDLVEHVDLQKVNRKVLESLIHAGAMDAFPGHRRQLLANLDRALAFGQKAARDRAGGQVSLFGAGPAADLLKPALLECDPFDPLVELSHERRAVGFFLSGHPFHEYRELVDSLPTGNTAAAHLRGEGTWVDLMGVITSHTKHRDKNKRVYARAHFEDRSGVIGLVVYSRLYEEAKHLVESDSILVIGGRVQVRSDGSREVVADRIIRIDEVMGSWVKDCYLKLDLEDCGKPGLEALGSIFAEFSQPCPLRPLAQLEQEEPPALGVGGAGEGADPGEGGDQDGVPIPAEFPGDQEQEQEAGGPDPGADPDLPEAELLARPVPLVVEVERQGRTWLLRSAGRNVSLTLDSLRKLRALPGLQALRIRAALPAPPERPKRFSGRA
ncbi:DNA polymerase III subunit alpha [bacterium]|nr:DNA polymerase III subunit alpha [bacterium]